MVVAIGDGGGTKGAGGVLCLYVLALDRIGNVIGRPQANAPFISLIILTVALTLARLDDLPIGHHIFG